MSRTWLALRPTTGSPPALGTWTTEGVSRWPSASAMTSGMPASTVATSELVVPRSMPTILLTPLLRQEMRELARILAVVSSFRASKLAR